MLRARAREEKERLIEEQREESDRDVPYPIHHVMFK